MEGALEFSYEARLCLKLAGGLGRQLGSNASTQGRRQWYQPLSGLSGAEIGSQTEG